MIEKVRSMTTEEKQELYRILYSEIRSEGIKANANNEPKESNPYSMTGPKNIWSEGWEDHDMFKLEFP